MYKVIQKLKLDNLNTRLTAIFILNVFDLIATTIWTVWFGNDVEGNPLARVMFENNSIYVIKTIGVAICLCFLYKVLPNHKNYEWTTWVLFGVYAGIAIYHIFLAFRLFLIFVFHI